jgi:hypothetical protein
VEYLSIRGIWIQVVNWIWTRLLYRKYYNQAQIFKCVQALQQYIKLTMHALQTNPVDMYRMAVSIKPGRNLMCAYNKPFNENASKKRWHGLAKNARPLTERYI